ncbi:MAG: aminopeptidase [Myxococcota bacterium]|nr:aminopeptidase [Myxococcota bacterium]
MHWAKTLILTCTIPISGCGFGYVFSSAYHQMTLLSSRVPIEQARRQGDLSPHELKSLDLIDEVRAYAKEIQLAGSKNFTSIALHWDKTIWNISASDPLSFNSKTWWFPIIGRIPYLGYFSKDAVDNEAKDLKEEGLDVYIRKVGAYSTLGWFEDPILRQMLEWFEYDLVNLVLHELTHATIWIPGSVNFNESFANFVGHEAAIRFLSQKYGSASHQLETTRKILSDRAQWKTLLEKLYQDLARVYRNPNLQNSHKLEAKSQLFKSLPAKVEDSTLYNKQRYLSHIQAGTWNNARLAQFKTYNSNQAYFQIILDQVGGDLYGFIQAIEKITDDAENPFSALQSAAAIIEENHPLTP